MKFEKGQQRGGEGPAAFSANFSFQTVAWLFIEGRFAVLFFLKNSLIFFFNSSATASSGQGLRFLLRSVESGLVIDVVVVIVTARRRTFAAEPHRTLAGFWHRLQWRIKA
eukprot:m.286858 g.286858  ORF g.286858 m.286858 type:complete len:110 (+) comp19441_c0_seq18:203-532(+)